MKIHHYFLALFILIFWGCQNNSQKPIEPNIIPKPVSLTLEKEVFVLNKNTSLALFGEFESVANFFNSYLKETFDLELTSKKSSNQIIFKKNDSIKNDEGYKLKISQNKILIEAKTKNGAFYAVQSLIQLLPIKSDLNEIAIQCLEIEDAPRFSYRGMHLDVARHFFSVDFIKKYLDIMAMLKMNTFHWHLTEDQGWRIEIKKYPKLQEIAAFRKKRIRKTNYCNSRN